MNEDKSTLLFTHLISMFHGAALIQMGKVSDPTSDGAGRDLERAQYSIDMLELIQNKCAGNLSQDEETLLTKSLHDLRLLLAEEKKK